MKKRVTTQFQGGCKRTLSPLATTKEIFGGQRNQEVALLKTPYRPIFASSWMFGVTIRAPHTHTKGHRSAWNQHPFSSQKGWHNTISKPDEIHQRANWEGFQLLHETDLGHLTSFICPTHQGKKKKKKKKTNPRQSLNARKRFRIGTHAESRSSP